MTDKSTFFIRLKEIRKKMKLTQAQAAEICGVRQETWSRYEKGTLSPGMDVLAAIAAAGGDVNYILTGEYSLIKTFSMTLSGEQVDAITATLSEREAKLLDNYRHIADEEDKRTVERTALMAARPTSKDSESKTKVKRTG
jgi:transcriptional regulator with XRE-family HTH domain